MKFGIRYKFGVGLLIIFGVSLNLISITINNIVSNNNENIIENEFLNTKKDLNSYFNQYIIINEIKLNSEELEKSYEKIGYALSDKINEKIILYNSNGEFVFDTNFNEGKFYDVNNNLIEENIDSEVLKSRQPSYKIIKTDEHYTAIFTFPQKVGENTFGIIRYQKDYTELFTSNIEMIQRIEVFMIFIFIIIFIFCFILSSKIVKPIIKLNNKTKEISNGNFDTDIIVKSEDEIGELSKSFKVMVEKVNDQIETIKKDRDDLIKLENHKRTFFNNVTHEIKTPLTIINGYAQMILDEEELDKEFAVKIAGKIKKQSNKLNDMVIEILNISRLESKVNNENMEKVNLGKTIIKICDELKVKAKKYEMQIEANLEDELYVYANKEDISSIIVNIVDNSIKYANTNSIIKINLYEEDKFNVFRLEDQSNGIPKEDLEKIFEPFYRGKDKKKKQGNGLGLSIVKSIIDKYNGEINISSEIDKGSKIYIKFPKVTTWQQVN